MKQLGYAPAKKQVGSFTGATTQANGDSGLVPQPLIADKDKFLKGDGSWDTAPSASVMTGADGTNAGTSGLVPAPAATDNTKFLKGNGTWDSVPDPSVMTGADGTDAGTSGLVPAPAATDNTKFLKGDGSWDSVPDPSVMTGADGTNAGTSGLVPAPAATDNTKFLRGNGTWAIPGMTILSYGHSSWNDFIAAYNANSVVYCRASSNSNPATGDQTRLAFMAYVNALTPTNVEFQYYRSVNSHSASQQGDQMYVYKLTSSGDWTVTVRESYTKIVAGTNLSSSYSNGVMTLTGNYSSFSGATSGANGATGLVPAPTTSDVAKFLCGNGGWQAIPNEILSYASESQFPSSGESGKIYVAEDVNELFRWDSTGTEYVSVGGGSSASALHKVNLSIATTDWTAITGGYSATVTDSNIGTDSEEIVIYNESLEELTSNIGYEKDTTNHALIFKVSTVPSSTISGRILIFTGNVELAYDDFTGATSQANGGHGLVPAPLIADKDKFLKGDGTWANVPSDLPSVSSTDNGKFLTVVEGAWAATTMQTWQGGSY